MNLFIDRKALAGFRRRALRRYPLEYIETLWGMSNKSGGVSIVEFRQLDHEATTDSVEFDAEDTEAGIRDGKLTQLGTIHTHPDMAYCEPSEDDWHDAGDRKEIIIGVMAIPARAPDKPVRRSRVQFYFAQALCNTTVQ